MIKKNVLVIEDDEDMNAIYKMILAKDYNVFVSPDTKDARKKLDENKIDLILLDLMLPNESGDEFLSVLKKDPKYKNIKVLIVSIFLRMMSKVKEIYPDIDAIPKPFKRDVLMDAIEKTLKNGEKAK